MLNGIDGIAYDLDGTITDTASLHEKAWVRAADDLGVSLTPDFLLDQKGLTGEEAARLVCEDEIAALRYSDTKREYVGEMFQEITIYEGFFETADKLRAQNRKVWICTSAPKSFIERIFAYEPRFRPFFDCTVYREMYANGKPDPEPLKLAFSRMHLAEAHCVYVGDAYSDYMAAQNAGCKFVYFCDPETARDAKIPADTYSIAMHSQLLTLLD